MSRRPPQSLRAGDERKTWSSRPFEFRRVQYLFFIRSVSGHTSVPSSGDQLRNTACRRPAPARAHPAPGLKTRQAGRRRSGRCRVAHREVDPILPPRPGSHGPDLDEVVHPRPVVSGHAARAERCSIPDLGHAVQLKESSRGGEWVPVRHLGSRKASFGERPRWNSPHEPCRDENHPGGNQESDATHRASFAAFARVFQEGGSSRLRR
jgi:hypothetical protein